MSETWKQWAGQTVNSEFPLLRYLGSTGHSAVFLTERPESGAPAKAAIKLILSLPESDEQQLARWRLAAGLSHPNVLRLYDSGRAEIGEVPVLYVVTEYAEESLAEVLPTRALSPEEVREVLEAALQALGYLHNQGLLHGHLKPSNIVAVGDRVKLSSDAVQRVGEPCVGPGRPDAYDPPEAVRGVIPVSEKMSPAADIWSLGMTLVEMLTQKLPDAQTTGEEESALTQGLPEPLLDIARHCLLRNPGRRWTVAQITARLRNQTVPAEPVIPARAVPPPATQAIHRPAPAPTLPQNRPPKRRSYTIPIAIGSVLLATLALPRLLRHRTDAVPPPDAASEQPAPADPSTPTQLSAAQSSPARQNGLTLPSASSSTSSATEATAEAAAGKQGSAAAVTDPAAHGGASSKQQQDPQSQAKLSAAPAGKGAVVQQVLPEVLPSARETIRGILRISVKVDVDAMGNVQHAEIASPAASKYFARVALEAAQRWKFVPPKVDGQSVLSNWSLQFDFTHKQTTVASTQEAP